MNTDKAETEESYTDEAWDMVYGTKFSKTKEEKNMTNKERIEKAKEYAVKK